jgi:hypothetical protein
MRSGTEPITSKRFGQVDVLGSGHFRIRYFRRCVNLHISFVSITGVVANSTARAASPQENLSRYRVSKSWLGQVSEYFLIREGVEACEHMKRMQISKAFTLMGVWASCSRYDNRWK